MVAGLAFALGRRILAPRPAVFLLAGLAFFAAALEQGKMWSNHVYPAVALVLLVVLADGLPQLFAGEWRDRALAKLGALAALVAWTPVAQGLAVRPVTTADLAPAIRSIGPEHPRLYALTGSIAAGNPLTSLVDGNWVGMSFGQSIAEFSGYRLRSAGLDPALRTRLQSYIDRDVAAARAGIAENPDFLMIDRASSDWYGWGMKDPFIAAALARYAPVDAAAGVELWARKDLLRQTRARR
jgi:hypothetical protein